MFGMAKEFLKEGRTCRSNQGRRCVRRDQVTAEHFRLACSETVSRGLFLVDDWTVYSEKLVRSSKRKESGRGSTSVWWMVEG